MSRKAPDELVSGAQAARRLGISRQRISQLALQGRLPEPLGQFGNLKVWRWADLAAWAQKDGRELEASS